MVSGGCKVEQAQDVSGMLPLNRTYRGNTLAIDADTTRLFGKRWVTRFDARLWDDTARVIANNSRCYLGLVSRSEFCPDQSLPLTVSSSPTVIAVSRAHGGRDVFTLKNGSWQSDKDITSQLRSEVAANGDKQWIYTEADGASYEKFSADGRLLSIHSLNGTSLTLTYSSGSSNDSAQSRWPANAPVCKSTVSGAVLPAGRLLCVTDQFQRQFNFAYDSKGRVTEMLDPAAKKYRYDYDGASGGCTPEVAGTEQGTAYCSADNLTKVTYPDGKTRIYYYNEARFINNGSNCSYPGVAGFGLLYNALTGIVDENGVRYASWRYNCQGLAIGSEHANGIEKVEMTYGELGAGLYGGTTVTFFNGKAGEVRNTVEFAFGNRLGVDRLLHSYSYTSQAPCPICSLTKSYTYDDNANVASKTNYNDYVTRYSYDLTRNLETSRTEAADTANQRVITTDWHPRFRLPAKISEPLLRTSFEYDEQGNLLSKTQQATQDNSGAQGFAATLVGKVRRWTYSYNQYGQLLSVTAPRTLDKVNYTYDVQGNLQSITNALGHVTKLSDYDAYGRVGKVVDANGLSTSFKYHVRGWLSERTVSGGGISETTRYDYDGLGQLLSVTLPDGTSLNYTYDDAHRLTDIRDGQGNRIHYVLDNQSNRLAEEITDASGQLLRKVEKAYDHLYRVTQTTGGNQ